ncbi:lipase [Apiospora marii]|uniref:Lipase n=1 Tax=Apiospora marii TaxID=335849 RepID=A0ABR1T1V1_9PEZI
METGENSSNPTEPSGATGHLPPRRSPRRPFFSPRGAPSASPRVSPTARSRPSSSSPGRNGARTAAAIGYVSAIWRVGGPSQWALTFWPSTRARVPNLLAVAADFRGTTVVVLLCVSVAAGVAPGLLCDPAAKQQTYDSGVVSALRRHGGGSAWGAHDVALLGLPERDNAAAVGRRRLGVPR